MNILDIGSEKPHFRYPEWSGGIITSYSLVMKHIIQILVVVGALALVFGVPALIPGASDTVDSGIFAPSTALAWDTNFGGDCCTSPSSGGSSGGGGGSPPPSNPPPKPSCAISANPSNIQYGGSTTLAWTSTNATSATLSGIGSVGTNGSHVANGIVTTTTYTLTVYGPGGSKNCQTTVTVQQQQTPSCTLTSNLSTVQYGGAMTLSWSSNNATSASLNQSIGSVGVNGTLVVYNIFSTTTYTLTVAGPGGTANCQTTVVVQQQQTPSCSISANPSSVQSGGSSTLTWSSTNATSATLNQSIGNVGLSGSYTVSPAVTTTYTLTVTGPGGTVNCQTYITVQQQQTPSCTINANPSNVQYGGSSTLMWSSTNATSATLTDFGSVATNGSQTASNIYNSKTYTLTVTGPGGSANCQTTVTSQQQQNLSCSINANPNNVQQGGPSYLTWSSNNATSASLTNVGSVNTNGNQTVYPYNTTTYILTVYGSQGQSAQCQTTVYTNTVYNNPPSCWITLSSYNNYNYGGSYNYNYNQQATLTWGSNNATSAFITPNVGAVSTSGSRTVYTDGYVMYTMTIYGQNGSATCQTQQNYVPPPPVYQPPIVTLTQIPYTGLDLGTVGTITYWFSILAFLAASLYLAVYYMPMLAGIKARVPAPVMEAPMLFAQSVAATVASAGAILERSAGWKPKDSMVFARAENGKAPRIVITRS